MPSLEQIRKNKYLKIVEKLKERKDKEILDKSEEEKLIFILKNIFTAPAFKWFKDLKEKDLQTYIDVGMNIINLFSLIPPYTDYIIEDIIRGKKPIKIKRVELIKMLRQIRGVKSKIEVIHNGKTQTLDQILSGSSDGDKEDEEIPERTASKDSRRLFKEGTPSKSARNDDQIVGNGS